MDVSGQLEYLAYLEEAVEAAGFVVKHDGGTLHSCAVEAQEMNLVRLLKPRIFIDGNAWCVLYGEGLQDGIAGFGKTPRLAVYAFNRAWDTAVQPTSHGAESDKRQCYGCHEYVTWLAPDSRCSSCTRLSPDEV